MIGGNLLTKQTYAYTTGTLCAAASIITYTYGNSTWGDQLTSYNGQFISYDAMGNPTSYLGNTMTWQDKQLATATKNGNNYGYFYDENGLRLRKTTNGVATNYHYNGSVLIGMTQGTTYQRFSYDASGNVLSVDYSNNSGSTYTTYYYLRNGQGDIVKLIDGTGTTVVQYTYDSWGKQLSCTGLLSSTLGTNQPFRYRGYVYDTETGWYYLQSRYYDPEVGRFISVDVMLSTGQGVLGHNAYAYCNNNPVRYVDSEGMYPADAEGNRDGPDEYAEEYDKAGFFKRIGMRCSSYLGSATFQQGIGGSAAFGAGVTGSISFVVDTSGSIGILTAYGAGGGSPSAGVYGLFGLTDASSIEGMEGLGCNIGGSANVYGLFTAGGDYAYFNDNVTQEGSSAYSINFGLSVKSPAPIEIHGYVTHSDLVWSFNIFEFLDELIGLE